MMKNGMIKEYLDLLKTMLFALIIILIGFAVTALFLYIGIPVAAATWVIIYVIFIVPLFCVFISNEMH